MIKHNKLLIIGIIISLFLSSCTQEEVQTTIENLPTLRLESKDFLRGTSTLQLSIEKEDDIEVTEVIFTANGQSLNVDTKQENGQWLFTFDSKQLEEGYHNFTFEALLSSEKELPQSSVKESFEIEVDNYLPTYLVGSGVIESFNYQDYFYSVKNTEITLMFLDKNQNPISDAFYLNDFSGEIKVLIPEDNRDQYFYQCRALSRTDTKTFNTNEESVAYVSYIEISSSNTEINDFYSQQKPKPQRKEITIGFPSNIESSLVINHRSAIFFYKRNEENDMIYLTFDLDTRETYESRDHYFFLATHKELDKSIFIMTEIMNDGDTISFNKDDINTQPKDVIVKSNFLEFNHTHYFFFQHAIVDGKSYYFDIPIYTEKKVDNKFIYRYTTSYFNATPSQIEYSVQQHNYNIGKGEISRRTSIIADVANSFNDTYPIEYLLYENNNSINSIFPTDAVEYEYSQINLKYESESIAERYVLSFRKDTIDFDFSKTDSLIVNAHNGKFKEIYEAPVNSTTFTIGNLGNTLKDSSFYISKTVYKNSISTPIRAYSDDEIRRKQELEQIHYLKGLKLYQD
ncbi:Ig-like domain-containing protein [Flammeovirga sp. SJP92]|uniref:Ig-like domain-containing protein n=1 Tax=Flammeovirga sp. SJP92 TaxID=1775430 RepID=UPI000786B151|nr:Ig-like domain-containing protein [Flammeovirga sp. SJP92]KXX71928.1 hypothetical protein AVL50_03845 [Flammeovirga sp. SJP92]